MEISWTDGKASFVQYITSYTDKETKIKKHFTNEQKKSFEEYLISKNISFITEKQTLDNYLIQNLFDKYFKTRDELMDYIKMLEETRLEQGGV